MQLIILSLGLVLISYLIGSISAAILVSKLFNLSDPRKIGSKNPGATNMLRVGGKLPALLTLLGDGLKGFIPVYLTRLCLPYYFNHDFIIPIEVVISAVFIAVILGHLYPIFFEFKGGKGVATAIGGLFGLQFTLGLSFISIWFVVAVLTRYSALSALIASALLPVIAYFIAPHYALPILIVSLLIFWRHRVNIQNLLNGIEPKMGGGR